MTDAREAGMAQAMMQSMVNDVYGTNQLAEPAPVGGDDMMPLPEAARACGVNTNTARGWVRRGLLASIDTKPVSGGYTHIVSYADMKRVRDMKKNIGGRPRKP